VDPDEAHRLLLSPRSSSQVTRQCGHGQDADVGAAACQRPVPSCRAVRGWRLFSTPSRAAQRWPGLPARRPPVAARPAHRGIDPSSMVDMLAAKRASFRYAGTPNDSKNQRQKRRAPSLVVMPTASSKSAGQGVGHSALDPQGTPAGRHWQSGQPRTRASCGLDVVPRRGLVWPATDRLNRF
jgi:hypothetical protein